MDLALQLTITKTVSTTITTPTTITVTITDVVPVTFTATLTTDLTTLVITVLTETVDEVLKRQMTVKPTSIPAYASACSNSVRYSSACSCIGVIASTTTAPTPSTTVTKTQTVTQVATSVATNTVFQTSTVAVTAVVTGVTTINVPATATVSVFVTPTSFILQATGGPIDGQYTMPTQLPDAAFGSEIILFSSDISSAGTFSIDAMGHLTSSNGGELADQNPTDGSSESGDDYNILFLDTPSNAAGFPQSTCSVALPGTLMCTEADGRNIFQYCSVSFDGLSAYFVLDAVVRSGCTAATLTVIPA
ncbi:hypothetical protein MMC13_001361 [Lambiella insularis]|nr:hypothetical protein [Lambiella insularis]